MHSHKSTTIQQGKPCHLCILSNPLRHVCSFIPCKTTAYSSGNCVKTVCCCHFHVRSLWSGNELFCCYEKLSSWGEFFARWLAKKSSYGVPSYSHRIIGHQILGKSWTRPTPATGLPISGAGIGRVFIPSRFHPKDPGRHPRWWCKWAFTLTKENVKQIEVGIYTSLDLGIYFLSLSLLYRRNFLRVLAISHHLNNIYYRALLRHARKQMI